MNQFMLELGLQQKIQELIEPVVDNLRTVNAKLDHGFEAHFQTIDRRLEEIEQVTFGKAGKDLRFERIEKQLEEVCIKQASDHKYLEVSFEGLVKRSEDNFFQIK